MAQGVLVDVDPAFGVGERALADEVGRTLWRHDVQQVVGDLLAHLLAVLRAFEDGDFFVAAHLDQCILEARPGTVGLHDAAQCPGIEGNAEQHCAAIAELDALGLHAVVAPVVGRQVHGLLRCARALDGTGGLGEHGVAALEVLHQLPGVGRQIETVVAGHPVLAERLGQPLDGTPVELDARSDHQEVITDALTIGQFDLVILGIEALDRLGDMRRAAGQHAAQRTFRVRDVVRTAARQGPRGLVKMALGGIDDGNVEVRLLTTQPRGHADAGGTASDDHNCVLLC